MIKVENGIKRNCNSCKHGMLFSKCETLNSNEEYTKLSERREGDDFFSSDSRRHTFKDKYICDNYKSRYIEYPIEVSKINKPDGKSSGYRDSEKGKLVKICPCDKKYNNKTFLGFYLGELSVGVHISHNEENKELTIRYNKNPAIFVPELKEIIYGMESWWGFIESEDELKAITADDIDNVWYVKMLKDMCNPISNDEI